MLKNKAIILLVILIIIVSGGIAAYLANNYFETNPRACTFCHVHDDAQKAWEKSEHRGINCHECHHSTPKEQLIQAFRFVVQGRKSVPERHGKVIVPWKLCMGCHWEKNNKYPSAPLVNRSQYHSKHIFTEQIECSSCHGYITHKFNTEERFCLKCHKGKQVHGEGMKNLPCLNCHTDRTKDLRPERKKCLFCHGGENVRKELIADGTLDVRHFQPDESTIKKAIKIKVSMDSPMQFYCYTCHKPHTKIRPDWKDCLNCHKNTPEAGRHRLHIKDLGISCRDCHKPHIWRVTEAAAKKDCVKCHEYRDPRKFLN